MRHQLSVFTVSAILILTLVWPADRVAAKAGVDSIALPDLTKMMVNSARITGKQAFEHIQNGQIEKLKDLHISKDDFVKLAESDSYDWDRVTRYAKEKNIKGMGVKELKENAAKRGKQLEERHRGRVKERLGRMLEKMANDGVDLKKCTYVDTEIAEPYMRSKEAFLYGADLNIVISHAGSLYRIQLDDCVAAHRGWVLVDGFRWNPKSVD